jgi:hypothetical protein
MRVSKSCFQNINSRSSPSSSHFKIFFKRISRNLFLLSISSIIAINSLSAQLSSADLFKRVSKLSSFEFSIANSGGLYMGNPEIAYWPRGSFHLITGYDQGFIFMAKKNSIASVSGANFDGPVWADEGPFA